MTTLAVIGDIHGELEMLDRVLELVQRRRVDGILLVGDLGVNALWGLGHADADVRQKMRYEESVDAVFSRVSSLGIPYLWVAGNHDLPEITGEGCIDRKVGEIAGLRVYGVGGAGPQHFGFPYEWEEEEIEQLVIPKVDILLCHAPPIRTELDRLHHNGQHVGSEAIREHAERHKGFLVCGHIHESRGADVINDCLCLNAGSLGAPYATCLVGFLTRVEGEEDRVGLYFLDDQYGVSWGKEQILEMRKMR